MLNPFHLLKKLFNLIQNNNREVSMSENKMDVDENMLIPESKTNLLSFFPIRNDHYEYDWMQVKENCDNLSEWGLEKLQKGLINSIRGIILEPFYICKDHRNLHSNFYSKRFVEKTSFASRLHFFDLDYIDTKDLILNPSKYINDYLGYSVIRPITERCIGRTVIDPNKLSKFKKNQNFYCLKAKFSARLVGQSFVVEGYPYTSQTTDVNLCAHVALWGMCRYLSQKYSMYKELYPFDIVQMTETSQGRTFPYRGMTYTDYNKILSEFGTFPDVIETREGQEKSIDLDRFMDLYTYVESGFPVLASFRGHVVTLIGHTLDFRIRPKIGSTNIIDSSQFLKQFVVIDDNFFPYQLLGWPSDPNNYGFLYKKEMYSIDSIATAVCPLPEKVFLPADKARETAMGVISDFFDEISTIGNAPWVTRLFLTTSSAFIRRKIEKISGKFAVDDDILYIIANTRMPHFIWVMEVGPLELYEKGICTTEIVIDPTSSMSDRGILYIRTGNKLSLSGIERIFLSQPSEFEQYTHNLGEHDGKKK